MELRQHKDGILKGLSSIREEDLSGGAEQTDFLSDSVGHNSILLTFYVYCLFFFSLASTYVPGRQRI